MGGSLWLRLMAGGAVWILLALVVAGIYIVQSFSNSIEAERRDDLQAGLERIVATIDPESGTISVSDPLTDPRYDTPLSGIYWQIDDLDSGERLRSRSLWDSSLPLAASPQGPGTLSQIGGPNGHLLVVLSRGITMSSSKGTRHLNVAVAEDRSHDDDPIQRFGNNLLLALSVLGAALLLAAIIQIYFGLQPLTLLRRQIRAVRDGHAQRLVGNTSAELRPVIGQINDLLDAQDASIAFARDRAADLAHGLKTPLAVLSATSERVRAAGDVATADVLSMLAEQMNSRIDYQLRIARLRYRTRARGAVALVNDVILRSVAVLRKSNEGERLGWNVNLDKEIAVNADSHDLMELIGILLENAAKWAESKVRITCAATEGMAELVVEDDGKGLRDEQIARLGVRGVRLDESSAGTGLGLSIAFEIVALNRGNISVDRGDLGGLRVTARLPLSANAAAPT